MGAFLSERTIARQTRKVPMLLRVEVSEYNHTIRRGMGKGYCLLKGETSDIDWQIYILGLCPMEEVIASQKGKYWRYRSADLYLVFCPRRES